MVLSELPTYHITSNIMAMGRSRPLRDSQSPVPRVSDKAGDISRAPSAIQGMLKNTTETGDVGPFSMKPNRFPHNTPRIIPTHHVVGQQDASRRSCSKQRHGDAQPNMSTSYPGNLTSSSLVSVHSSQNQRSYRPLSRGPINDDERSYSISQSSHTNRSGPSPRLPSSYRFQGQGDMYGARPRSPYAYPTRLKRPGYRPSSPAYSDINRSFHPHLAGFYPEASFHTRSPMSTPKRVPSGFQQGLGHPDSSFSFRPSSPGRQPHRMGSFSPSSTRVPTPGFPLGHVQPISQIREALNSNAIYAEWDSRRSASPLPVFYDYTEAFEEESHFNTPISSEEGQAVPQDDVKLCGELELKVRSANGADEKETITRSTHQEEIIIMENSSQSLTEYQKAAIGILRRSVLKQQSSPTVPFKEEPERTVLAGQDQPGDNLKRSPPQQVQSEGSIKSPSESARKLHNGQHEAGSSDVMAASVHLGPQSVSSSETMYSVQSSTRPEISTFSLGSADTVKPSSLQIQPTNSSKVAPNDFNTRMEQLPPLKTELRELSLDRWSESEPSQIYAPTPERSISSPNHRRKFSRILSIGEGSIADSGSDIAPKQAGSDQNKNFHRRGITIDVGKTEAITASSPKHTSISLPNLGAAGEDQGDLAFRDALMKVGGSEEELNTHISITFNNDPTRISRSESVDPACDVLTPLDALKAAAKENLAASTSKAESVSQTGRPCDEEPNSLSVASTLHSRVTNLASLSSEPTLKAYSPPPENDSSSLPCSFLPISASREDDDTLGNDVEALVLEQKEEGGSRRKPSRPRLNLKKRAEKASIESLPGSRPWNLATSYPWTDEYPKLDVKLPDTNVDSQADDAKLPRFRLKVHRASSSTVGPMKLVKQVPPPLELFAARKNSLSSDLFSSSAFNRKPRPSITITQNNSSHIGPSATRSAGNLISPPRTSIASPCISLVPPSPGLNLEVRSFFSDDSSQVQPKGSLRKRISQLRAMATGGPSSDNLGGAERGLLSSAMGRSRTSGRSVRQEGIPSEGLYNLKHLRWRLEAKVKGWLHRGKDKVRVWGGKMRLPGPNTRPGVGVYSGI